MVRTVSAPQIRKLTIERFRSIQSLTWCPAAGVNFILGGGDMGKTTILDAIALLLSPYNPSAAAEVDYFGRDSDAGFTIEAVIALAAHRAFDPETFLSKISVVGEGITEVGFLLPLLETALGAHPRQLGLHVSDGRGQDTTVGLLDALCKGGLSFAALIDNEGRNSGKVTEISQKVGKLLFQWPTGCLEENLLALVPDDKLEEFIDDPDKGAVRRRSLAQRLNITDKEFAALKVAAGANLRGVITSAMLGKVPAGREAEKKDFEAHAKQWFKTLEGGDELFRKVGTLALWPGLKGNLLPFLNAIRSALNLPEIQDLPL